MGTGFVTDQEIADALVEAGIGCRLKINPSSYYISHGDGYDHPPLTAGELVTDWRVAGACLEWMREKTIRFVISMKTVRVLKDPRAICEAFAESQS